MSAPRWCRTLSAVLSLLFMLGVMSCPPAVAAAGTTTAAIRPTPTATATATDTAAPHVPTVAALGPTATPAASRTILQTVAAVITATATAVTPTPTPTGTAGPATPAFGAPVGTARAATPTPAPAPAITLTGTPSATAAPSAPAAATKAVGTPSVTATTVVASVMPTGTPTGTPSPATVSATPSATILPSAVLCAPTATVAGAALAGTCVPPARPLATSVTASPVVAAIAPATVANDRPATVTLMGSAFVAGMTVAVGDQSLTDVRVQSATTLTATLPTGLCPGTYAATVSDAQGKKGSGGTLVVRGVRDVTFAGTSPGQTARRTGQVQKLTMPLPDVQISDTTCATGDWSLVISVAVPADASGNRGAFTPQAFRLESSGGAAPVLVPLSVHGGEATAIVHLPRAAARGILLRTGLDGEIPANAPAGQYTLSVTITFAG